MTAALLVLCTCPDATSAQAIATAVVEARLAACVNILPELRSVYAWEGRVEQSDEVLLLVKTTPARFAELKERIVAMHPYRVPEILAFEAAAGLETYLRWIGAETSIDANTP